MTRSRTPLLLALAFGAGACGLAFEMLWARMLALEAGNSLAAFTAVVTGFLTGLALGAWWIGRLSDRTDRPLRLFGILEMGVGLLGLASAWAWQAGGLTRMVISAVRASPDRVSFALLMMLAGGLLAAIPAVLMGGTLPLLLRAFRGAGTAVGRRVGAIAAANALGAALGALVAGFLLLPRLGLTGSLRTAAFLGLAIGATGWAAGSRHVATSEPGTPRPGRARETDLPSRGTVLLMLVAAGAALTSLEVIWARLASLSFGSSAQAGSLVLAAVILGLALGNALGGRWTTRARTAQILVSLLGGAAVCVLALLPVAGRMPLIALSLAGMGDTGPSPASLHAWQFFSTLLLAGLPSLLLGAAFPLGFEILSRIPAGARPPAGRTVGLASAVISLGNLLGAPLAYLALHAQIGSRSTLLLSSGLLSASVLLSGRSVPRAGAAAGLGIALMFAAWLWVPWDPALMSSGPYLYGSLYRTAGSGGAGLEEILERRGRVVFSREGPQALVTVRELPDGVLSLQVNGKTDASTGGDMRTQILMAQLPMILRGASGPGRPAPARTLVVGLGSGITVASALTHEPSAIDVIEISAEVVEASAFFAEANHGVLADPRVRLIVGDARSWLQFGEAGYDVIVSQPSNPWISGEAVLFTREFFSTARSRLNPGGLMCQWLQGYGLEPEDFRSVVATFASVFPNVTLWEESTAGGDYILVGSQKPLRPDPVVLATLMSRLPVASDLSRIEIDGPLDLLSLLVSTGPRLAEYAGGAGLQTEDRLSLEFTAARALHRDTLGGILGDLEGVRVEPATMVPDDPPLAQALTRRARATREERAWARDLGLLRAMPRAGPELFQAVSFLRAGMTSRALERIRSARRVRPREVLPHLLAGHVLMSLGRTSEAAEALEQAVELDPENARRVMYLSRALFAAGRLDEALRRNAAARRLDPEMFEAAADACAMLLRLGDEPSAEAACLEAIQGDPGLASAHANLGVVRWRRGRADEAEQSYRRALELAPHLDDARYNLAALYEWQDRGDEGLEVLGPLLGDVALHDGALLRLAARLARDAGDPDGARRYLAKSRVLEPGNPEIQELERMLR